MSAGERGREHAIGMGAKRMPGGTLGMEESPTTCANSRQMSPGNPRGPAVAGVALWAPILGGRGCGGNQSGLGPLPWPPLPPRGLRGLPGASPKPLRVLLPPPGLPKAPRPPKGPRASLVPQSPLGAPRAPPKRGANLLSVAVPGKKVAVVRAPK